MNQITQLRQLIRESIQEYIREIDAAGDRAALEAKMKACEEAIAIREKKSNMDGLDEAYHDMLDKSKIGELKKEIKALGKTLEKYKKQLAKMDGKNEPKAKEEKEMVDEAPEVTAEIDTIADPNAGPQLEEGDDDLPPAPSEEETDANQVYEMLLMQKRAGIISETEYAAKLEEAKKMTAAQKEKKEDIVKGMKKSKSFGKSKEEKAKMYATATKLATKKKDKSLKEEVEALFEDEMTEGKGQGTTVGKLLNMISSIPSNAFISLNYDGKEGTEVRALNYIDDEGLDGSFSGDPEIILVGETDEDPMTVGELKTQLSKLDPSTYVTLNLDLENGTQVVNNIKVDDEGLDGSFSGEPEIILFGNK